MEIDIDQIIDIMKETHADEITYSFDIQKEEQKYTLEYTLKKAD